MTKTTNFLAAFSLLIFGLMLVSADHSEAPAVSGGHTDITDFYAYESTANSSNMVFAVNTMGLMSPSTTASASFDETVLIEINIDNDGDNIEDLVIQATPRDGKMYFFGPVAPASTGISSTIMKDATYEGWVSITPYTATSATVATNTAGTISYFAGPREDPFYFDFAKYGEIIAGNATGFDATGSDTFAGSNVMSVVIEVPKSILGGTGTINCWVETKTKQ
jgi:hypothetical protein